MAQPQQITSDLYPFLPIRLNIRGHRWEALALLDTGFTGHLAVPLSVLRDGIGLPDGRSDWELADGSMIDAPTYLGSVEIVGFPPIPATVIFLGNENILGRGVLDRFKVTFDHGQRVVVEA